MLLFSSFSYFLVVYYNFELLFFALHFWNYFDYKQIKETSCFPDDMMNAPDFKILGYISSIQSIVIESVPSLNIFFKLLQRAAQMFREEHFKNFTNAREELEKRVHTLDLLKRAQQQEIGKMNGLKDELRINAENLAEKYEDIKDKQDELLKR